MTGSTVRPRTRTTGAVLHRDTAYGWANSTILMGVFTALWGTIATMNVPEPWTYVAFGIIGAIALGLVAGGISLLKPARQLPEPSPEEAREAARQRRLLGMSFGAEVVLLLAGFPFLAISGLGDLMAPFGALVVGLHFLPFGWIFGRRLDYVIGGWTIAWAVAGFVMIALSRENVAEAWTVVGLAASAATIAYGVQMFVSVRTATAAVRRGSRAAYE